MESNPETTKENNTTQEANQTQKANESLPKKSEPSTDLKKLITKIDNRIKTKDVTDTKGHNFEDYELKIELLKGIYEKGYEKPSPVQEEVIPIALTGKDIIARAKNGTGKTASFVIPILEKLDFSQKCVQAVILVPTRELALQISSTIKEIGKYLNVQCMITTGGTNLKDDIYRLNYPVQILVGRFFSLKVYFIVVCFLFLIFFLSLFFFIVC